MKISAVLYLIVIIAFFMPFFVVRCQQTELVTVKGIQLVTGGEAKLDMGEMLSALGNNENKQEDQKIKAQPSAIAALAIAIICLVLVLVLPQKLYLIPALFSLAGAVCLHFLRLGMAELLKVPHTGMDPSMDFSKFLSIQAKSGYWLAFLFFILGGGLTIVLGILNKSKESFGFSASPQAMGYEHIKPIPPLAPLHHPDPEMEIEEPFEVDDEQAQAEVPEDKTEV